jgi:hypothetical protein
MPENLKTLRGTPEADDMDASSAAGQTADEDLRGMPLQVLPVLVCKWAIGAQVTAAEPGKRVITKRGAEHRRTVPCESDEPRVEGGVPISGEEEAVMDVQALGVIAAVGPRLDMAGAQQLRLGDTGDGAATLPVVKQPGAKLGLAKPAADERFDLGAEPLVDPGERRLVTLQRRVGQGPRELPDPANEGGKILGVPGDERLWSSVFVAGFRRQLAGEPGIVHGQTINPA